MSTITDPIMLDSTGQAIKNSIDLLSANINRTASNIPYDNNLTIKGKIDEIDAKTADDIPYLGGVSISDMLTPTEIMSANTSDYVTYARKVGKIIFFSFFAKREFTPSSPIVQIPVYVGGEVNINDASIYSYPQKLKIQSNGNVVATDTVIKNQAFYLMTFIIP